MKKLYHASKQQLLDKLEYAKKIFAAVAEIVKSFATIIGSLVAGTTAGVTGYYEVKKVFKKERVDVKASVATNTSESVREGVTTTTETIVSTPASSTMEPTTYSIDMNTGAFALSLVMLTILILSKIKKNMTKS